MLAWLCMVPTDEEKQMRETEVRILKDPKTEAGDSNWVVCPPAHFDLLPEQIAVATQVTCSNCGQLCWRAPSSPSHVPVICYTCVPGLVDSLPPEEEVVYTMSESMAQNLGLLDL